MMSFFIKILTGRFGWLVIASILVSLVLSYHYLAVNSARNKAFQEAEAAAKLIAAEVVVQNNKILQKVSGYDNCELCRSIASNRDDCNSLCESIP